MTGSPGDIKDDGMPLVSVVVPFYNSEKFIMRTLDSVFRQTYTNLEILCVSDGSRDRSEELVRAAGDPRVQCLSKPNTGVSDTRNYGLSLAKGKYILFLDSDDLLHNQFIARRVTYLEENPDKGFCVSNVTRIDEHDNTLSENSRAPYDEHLLEEILLYKHNINTCPSIFLIRKSILDAHQVRFNTKLSSSADRFFLIELSQYTTGGYISEGADLYYRIHYESMSNKLTIGLVNDNRLYYDELRKKQLIPVPLYRDFSFKINYILAGSFFKLRKIIPCINYSLKAFYYKPFGFFKQLNK